MTPEALNKIYSNDYADFFISYNGDPLVLEPYKNDEVNIINFFLAVVHLPVSEMTEDVISRRSYSALPSLFGLTSEMSLEASGVQKLRSIPNFDLRGKGVLIGIVDTGIDYTNPVFQYADKTTKIASIWDQTIISPQTFDSNTYGTIYSKEQINEAIRSEDPFSIVPSKDEIGHGTMVAGIAAGSEVPESGFYGVAPDAELVIVKLKPAKSYLKKFFRLPDNAISYQENDVILGIEYLIDYAAELNKPIVICVSVNTSKYAHDGSGTTSTYLSFLANLSGVAVIIPVGNERNNRRHYFGTIKEALGYDRVELNVGPNESGFSMEIWGNSPNIYSFDIISPSGEYISRMGARVNESIEIHFIFEPTVIYVDYESLESQSGEQLILLRFTNPAQGIWKFNVYGKGIFPMNFNIWLPMGDYITTETYFIRSDPSITLLSLACAIVPITVTAYNTENESLYINAGRGYTRIDAIKPDLAAPGVNILSPSLNHDFTQVTGSCAAAAHTAGITAMLFEWGIVNGNYPKMSTQDIKIFMIRGARRNLEITYPNRDWGYGILDIFKVFDNLRRGI